MKKPLVAFIYYLAAFAAIFYCGRNYKTGPCNLNLDVFSILLLIPVSIGLLIRNITKWTSIGKPYIAPTCIHLAGCSAMILYFFMN